MSELADGGDVLTALLGSQQTSEGSLHLTRDVLDAIPAEVALLDYDGTILLTNAAWDRFAAENGADPALVGIGLNYLAVSLADPSAAGSVAGLRDVLSGRRDSFTIEYACDSPDTARWFLMDCRRSSAGVVVFHFDVTKRKLAEIASLELASTDPLTGVLNRRGLDNTVKVELARMRQLGTELAVIMIDVDDFKAVNDSYGHSVGDQVLIDVTERLRTGLRPSDVVARLGGDEFILLLPDTSMIEAEVIAERLRLTVATRPVQVSEDEVPVTLSMAFALADSDVLTVHDLLHRLRDALRLSKRRGKDQVTPVASTTRLAAGLTRSQLQELLREPTAIDSVGQPVMELRSGRLVAVEMLSRSLNTPQLSPATIFHAAKEAHLLTALDEACLMRSLAGCRQLPSDVIAMVNVFPTTLLAMPTASVVAAIESVAGSRVCLELSEEQLAGDQSPLLERLAGARAAGALLALDDLGVGTASLHAVVSLAPDLIKIDGSLVSGVARDEAKRSWISRLTKAAHALEATVIAEGIETDSDAATLGDLGVDYGQGYLFSKPLPLDELGRFWSSR